MTDLTTEKDRFEYVAVDPRLAKALESRGTKSYTNLLLELAGTQDLDDHTKKGLFWQLIGWLAAEAGRAAARPWMIAAGLLGVGLMIVLMYLYNLLFLMALGLI